MKNVERLQKNLQRWSYYATEGVGQLIPRALYRRQREACLDRLNALPEETRKMVKHRVAYYNRLNTPFRTGSEAVLNRDFRASLDKSTYHFDLYRVSRYFPETCQFHYVFGDVTQVPDWPAFVKSRPIAGIEENARSVLLKLDSIRHYYRIPDPLTFEEKTPRLVWRGAAHQPHRREFLARHFANPLCDVGATDNKPATEPYRRPFMSLQDQLRYRFILSIEGNDVATNLKWIMSSDSLCFMRRPRFETWFMEGLLVPNQHYVCLADDYSDLEEKIDYYTRHTDEARVIIANAKRHVAPFYQPQMEMLISLLVFDKYLRLSGQR
ncbi:glycosyl transferase family 90 [Halomonas sp. NO4]|uniref:glycosyl transferase family 90 n=1 Tax=Halomonas sp. NO4 TaxID=2484813 RepID=UPI0013D1E839|nr:glycosyl transferase family 90 [Halomonas sp. NO4]